MDDIPPETHSAPPLHRGMWARSPTSTLADDNDSDHHHYPPTSRTRTIIDGTTKIKNRQRRVLGTVKVSGRHGDEGGVSTGDGG